MLSSFIILLAPLLSSLSVLWCLRQLQLLQQCTYYCLARVCRVPCTFIEWRRTNLVICLFYFLNSSFEDLYTTCCGRGQMTIIHRYCSNIIRVMCIIKFVWRAQNKRLTCITRITHSHIHTLVHNNYIYIM